MTAAHFILSPVEPLGGGVTVGQGDALVACYRRARAALNAVLGCDGFMISLALRWRPDADAIDEPEPSDGSVAVHVFGRSVADEITPAQAMAVPAGDRRPVMTSAEQAGIDARLERALTDPRPYEVPALADRDVCDGCSASVLTDQERWRADDVRVIRPQRVLIDPHVLVLPLWHVPSLGDLTGREVASIAGRLGEALAQFGLASGSTGLSCFAIDGARAGQETPHVHLHVFGRAADETANPFVLLRQRLHAPLSTGDGG